MRLFVTTPDGRDHEVEASTDVSVMEILRDAGFDDVLAICGGNCSCATCHVKVAEDWLEMLPPLGEEEDVMLDTAQEERDRTSRLSCQLPFQPALDGMRLRIAEN